MLDAWIASSMAIQVSPPRSCWRRHWPSVHTGDVPDTDGTSKTSRNLAITPHSSGQIAGYSSVPGSEVTWKFNKMEINKPIGYWDHKVLQVLHKYEEPGHPVVPGTTILKHGTLTQKKRKRQPLL